MFMAISRKTWDGIGRPSFKPDAENDVAQRLNDIARAAGVEIERLDPFGAIVPKWRLGDVGFYGRWRLLSRRGVSSLQIALDAIRLYLV